MSTLKLRKLGYSSRVTQLVAEEGLRLRSLCGTGQQCARSVGQPTLASPPREFCPAPPPRGWTSLRGHHALPTEGGGCHAGNDLRGAAEPAG